MEADLIHRGFLKANDYGLRYTRMIAMRWLKAPI